MRGDSSRSHRLVDDAEELPAGADPAGAFYAFLARWAELSASKHLLADALVSEEVDIHSAAVRAYPQVRDELFRVVSALLARAQAAGAVRADVGIEEVSALLVGMTHAAEHTRGDPAVGARTLEVICDGLRPPRRPAPGGS